MSATAHAHGAGDHTDAHGHHDDHGHDDHGHDDDHGEPPPPEPASPAWLPLLGGALFLLAFLVYLFTSADDAATPEARAERAGAAEGSANAAARPAAPDARIDEEDDVRPRRAVNAAPPPGGTARILPRMARPLGSVPGVNLAASGRVPNAASPGAPPRPMPRPPAPTPAAP